MTKPIGVAINGETTWHCKGGSAGGYDTLCGIDVDDPTIGHGGEVEARRGQKVTCRGCRLIWEEVTAYRRADFEGD